MKKYLIISCSLNEKSHSHELAKLAHSHIPESELVWLRDDPLPMCDGGSAYQAKVVKALQEKVGHAKGVLIATPIYNFNVAGSTKNMVDLVSDAWKQKPVGFMCAAGGGNSYMAVMPLANSLMLYFRSVIIPRFVYASGPDFKDDKLASEGVKERVQLLAQEFVQYADLLSSVSADK